MRWVSGNGASFLGQLYVIFMLPNNLNGLENMGILFLKIRLEFAGQMNALLSVELELELLGPLFDH